MRRESLSLLLLFAVVCLLATLASSDALTPAARIAKLGWKQAGPASPKATVKFTLALKQRNLDIFEKMFLEISNPKSPQYAQYLSIDDILDIVAPPEEDAAFVVNWLKEQCEENEITNLRDALKVKSTVACVEKMFRVKLHNYKYRNTPFSVIKTKLNTPVTQIPNELRPYVDLLEGLSRLPIPRKATHKNVVDGSLLDLTETFNYVIPSVARRLYNIPEGTSIQSSQSSHSVIEFLPVGAPYISDMQMFSEQADETFSNITKIVGPFEEGSNDGESTLDIQYISALAPGGENWYITIEDGWQYEFALELFNMADAPWVNSVSYGWPEQKSCQSGITHADCKGLDSKTYVERANVEFQKIGTRGITVIVCSQDEGAPSEANEDCQLDSTHPVWSIYPSASPWVTTVSGTTVIDTGSGGNQPQPPICASYPCASGTLEYPCMINNTLYTWTTGGGFSSFAPRPSYQETAVQQWLSSGAIAPPQRFFNSSNRGYPDISALGSRILIIQSGAVAVTAGTSASTPIIAAIMALLNDYRFQQGKPSLGFLNPLLYQMAAESPQTFQIVSVGNNQGTIGVECEYGYGASWGWDPVTGLGTPNYGEMINYLNENLP